MHELSVCRAIADIVSRHAAGRPVSRVRVRVGALRQVVPDTLVRCWQLGYATTGPVPVGPVPVGPVVRGSTPGGSVLRGSVLEVEGVPARVRCRQCDARGELVRLTPQCAGCGSMDVDLTSGDEFVVASFDLAPATAAVL